LIHESGGHYGDDGDGSYRFDVKVVEGGGFTGGMGGVLEQLAAIALNEPLPPHVRVALGEAEKEVCVKALDVGDDRACGEKIQKHAQDDERRREEGGGEGGLWGPPKMVRGGATLKQKEQEIHEPDECKALTRPQELDGQL
jgi:hypothetical protein